MSQNREDPRWVLFQPCSHTPQSQTRSGIQRQNSCGWEEEESRADTQGNPGIVRAQLINGFCAQGVNYSLEALAAQSLAPGYSQIWEESDFPLFPLYPSRTLFPEPLWPKQLKERFGMKGEVWDGGRALGWGKALGWMEGELWDERRTLGWMEGEVWDGRRALG